MPAALVENSQVICEVWASNLEEEMRKIREIVLSYSYIAMVSRSSPPQPGKVRLMETSCIAFVNLSLQYFLFIKFGDMVSCNTGSS